MGEGQLNKQRQQREVNRRGERNPEFFSESSVPRNLSKPINLGPLALRGPPGVEFR